MGSPALFSLSSFYILFITERLPEGAGLHLLDICQAGKKGKRTQAGFNVSQFLVVRSDTTQELSWGT